MKVNSISNISFKANFKQQQVKYATPVVAYPELPDVYSSRKNEADVVDNGIVKGLVNKIAMVSDILFSKPIEREANRIKASINEIIDTVSCEPSQSSKLDVVA